MLSMLRSCWYLMARLLGDAQAVRKGPHAMAKRLVRRAAGKATGRLLGRVFR
jgi:hypothetical protein